MLVFDREVPRPIPANNNVLIGFGYLDVIYWRNLSITEAQYRAGAVSYLAVVTAHTSELSVERGLIDVQTRRLVAINALLKNLAGRWPEPALG